MLLNKFSEIMSITIDFTDFFNNEVQIVQERLDQAKEFPKMILKSLQNKLNSIYSMLIFSRTPHRLRVFIGWNVNRSNSFDL